MKVIVTGGGTGGHVNPAIAIANTIKKNIPGAEITFVGTEKGIENRLVPKEGYPLYHVNIQGLKRRLTPSNIKTLVLAYTSVFKAKKLLKSFAPDLVVGTGGYVSWPVVKAASEMGIPSALHESNAVPGFAVRMLEKHVDKIFVNFDETLKYLKRPQKAVRVGNPIRGEFCAADREEARRALGIKGKYRFFILSCGGSMGAEPINDAVFTLMRDYIANHPEILHIHASGSLEYAAAKAKFAEYGLDGVKNAQLVEYIYDMPQKMAAADLVVNRAGAITLSELAVLAKPCILIPSPYVTDNHQYKNAKVLADAGAALLIEEKELAGGALERGISSLIGDKAKMVEMAKNIGKFAVHDASERIFNDLMALAKKE